MCINIDLLLSVFKKDLSKNYKFNVYDLDEKDMKSRHKEALENLKFLTRIVLIYKDGLKGYKADQKEKRSKADQKEND